MSAADMNDRVEAVQVKLRRATDQMVGGERRNSVLDALDLIKDLNAEKEKYRIKLANIATFASPTVTRITNGGTQVLPVPEPVAYWRNGVEISEAQVEYEKELQRFVDPLPDPEYLKVIFINDANFLVAAQQLREVVKK